MKENTYNINRLFKKVEPYCQRPFRELYFSLSESERELLRIVDSNGRNPRLKCILSVYNEAIITAIHGTANDTRVFIEIALPD